MNRIAMKEVTIIIVTYKSSHIIDDALKNIANKGYRIIIVDNDSNDEIKGFLQEKYPNSGIELVILEKNCGFGKANNVALKMTDTEFALLLNPDAIIKEESIKNLVKCAKKDQKIALAGAIDVKSENPNDAQKKDALKTYYKIFKIIEENNDFISVNFLCGGYVMLRMEIFRKIGFFDENLFLYGEDDEICGRSLINGYKNALVKDAFAYHRDHNGTKTNGKFDEYKLLYKRHWNMGWGKAYLKRRKKNYLLVISKAIIQFFSAFLYLFKLDFKRVVIRIARSFGSISNLIGIDCFNKYNKIPKIKEHVKI